MERSRSRVGMRAVRKSAAPAMPGRPACPHYPVCPGCPWFGRPYAQQLADKHRRVVAALHDALGAGARAVEVAPVMAGPEQIGYRVQAKLMVASGRDRAVIGLYRPGRTKCSTSPDVRCTIR